MSEASGCPHCGERLPADGPAGVCPTCVLRLGLETNGAGFARDKAPEPAELAASFPQLEVLELVGQRKREKASWRRCASASARCLHLACKNSPSATLTRHSNQPLALEFTEQEKRRP